MNLFKKRQKRIGKQNMSIWDKNIPDSIRRSIWDMYLDTRDMEDQILAKEIADRYGIDYSQPVLTNGMVKEFERQINNIKKFKEEERVKNIVIEVLKEKELVDK